MEVNSVPMKDVKWFKDGIKIVSSDRTSMIKDGRSIVLMIVDVRERDSGQYVLHVGNEMGDITCRSTLTIAGGYLLPLQWFFDAIFVSFLY